MRAWRNDPRRAGQHLGQQRILSQGGSALILDLAQESDADVVTIGLTRSDAPTAAQEALGNAAQPDAPLFGVVTYGVGAFTESVEVDWINGTLLTLPAGNVNLTCSYPVVALATGWDQRVGAHATLGTRTGSAGSLPLVRRTQRIGALAAGATSVRQNVPARSQAVRLLLSTPAAYSAIELSFCRAAITPALGPTSPPLVLYRLAPGGAEPIPFTTDIRAIALRSSYSASVDVTLLFDLAL